MGIAIRISIARRRSIQLHHATRCCPMCKNQKAIEMRRLALSLLTAIFASVSPLLCAAIEIQEDSPKHYDLQSLVYLSQEVIEGELRDRKQFDTIELVEFRVLAAYKGTLKPGDTIFVAGTKMYRKASRSPTSGQLDVGEQLVLFLNPGQREKYDPKELPDCYLPIERGVRLIQGETTYDFEQWFGEGDYWAKSALHSGNPHRVKPLKALRSEIQTCVVQVPVLAKLIEAKSERLDVPQVLKQLKATSADIFATHNYFNEIFCQRLAETRDFEQLGQALLVTKNGYELRLLYPAFISPAGRDFLLAKVADKGATNEARLCYCQAFYHTGPMYRLVATYQGNRWQYAGEVDADNSHYLNRIAQLIQQVEYDEQSCVELLRALKKFSQSSILKESESLQADMVSALAVLQDFYKIRPSAEIQYAVETLMARYPDRYQQLNSPCGNAIMILRSRAKDKLKPIKGRTLSIEVQYHTPGLSRDKVIQPTLVLLNLESQKTREVRTTLKIEGGISSFNGEELPIHPSIPAGKYRVYLEWREGGKVLSTSHGYELELE